ncbi:MAG: hypothetical protein P4L85_05360 [Paludisphaera borealis]|uniref:hypothetical protein n=1 Tax=Paludisphaera borealis TaxID=1387353 RepID=UPI00283FA589|nr:hypothetical protein [Paludisphaera borealis]MDR3618758.1 hypothetical protein [Paludisphaera borealis]
MLQPRDVAYHDLEDYSLKDRKQAILEVRTLSRRLRGAWSLSDVATGQEVARKTSTLAHIPYCSNKGTFIRDGSQYSLTSQIRLHPGVFTRLNENGELDSHVNVMPGQGVSHDIHLDPESDVFKLNVSRASYPLSSVLKLKGVKDFDLRTTARA